MTDKKDVFSSWYGALDVISDKGILLLKNGLEYKIALTSNKKPQFKKQTSKTFKSQRKKFEITGVKLLSIDVANQKEIDMIVTKEPTEEQNYKNISFLQLDTSYVMKLTEQQYKNLLEFLKFNTIDLNEEFFMRRFGKKFSTFYKFHTKSQITGDKKK